ncbi:MAG: outer membrane protein transport protein [Betaproteobacteria bacterium]|nr:outer membrane protein transport protein [Betaproteobacteria bacterium]
MGRYQGVKSDLKTLNVKPAIAWKINDAVGRRRHQLPEDRGHADAGDQLLRRDGAGRAGGGSAGQIPGADAADRGGDQRVSTAPARSTATTAPGAGTSACCTTSTSKSRIGAHYRSSIKYDVVGSVNFNQPALPANLPPALAPAVGAIAAQVNASPTFANGGVNLAIELPPKFNLSYFGALDDRWDLMADVQWTGWSSIPEFKVVRNNGTVLTDQHWNYDDSWRFSGGANYHYNNQWMFRGGIAYDQTPTNDLERSVRLPDSDRVWLSAGAQYKWDKNWVFDVGFTYIIGQSASIDQYANATAASIGAYGKVKGDYDASVTILSGQVTYSF